MGGSKVGAQPLRPGDVACVAGPARSVQAHCRGAGVEWAAWKEKYVGCCGTVNSVDRQQGGTAAMRMADDREVVWPLPALEPRDSLPPHLYDRNLLSQIRRRKGKGLKALGEELDQRPRLRERFNKERRIELDNASQREKMMWATDARSRVKSVKGEHTLRVAFTDPMARGVIPAYGRPEGSSQLDDGHFQIHWDPPKRVTAPPPPELGPRRRDARVSLTTAPASMSLPPLTGPGGRTG